MSAPTQEPRRRLQIRLPESLARQLDEAAAAQSRSTNNLVEALCRLAIDVHQWSKATVPQPPPPEHWAPGTIVPPDPLVTLPTPALSVRAVEQEMAPT